MKISGLEKLVKFFCLEGVMAVGKDDDLEVGPRRTRTIGGGGGGSMCGEKRRKRTETTTKKKKTTTTTRMRLGRKLEKTAAAVGTTLALLVLICPSAVLTSRMQWSPRVVSTSLGSVRGFLFLPRNYEGVEVFLGLPYASPPVGPLRFMPPVSASPWSGTKMTESPAPVCPQVLPDIFNETDALKSMPRGRLNLLKRLFPLIQNQTEDCLYLNVFVPLSVSASKPQSPLPVLVFVHGDDYSYGAGHPYDPSMLASQGNIIVVTMNYRLGILGFLNANSEGYFKSPANFALLDQIAALHWVQEHIGAFGGDRTNVTLMGHGKGAVFVNFLMISSAVPTGLLFHRVILMSGSALSPWAHGSSTVSSSGGSMSSTTSPPAFSLTNGKDISKRFAQKVRCPSEPPSSMLECLRQVPLEHYTSSEIWSTFGPSEDGVIIEDGFRESLLRDRLSKYPLMFGVSKAEMLPFISEHDAVYGLETEKRREVLKQFVERFFNVHRNEILAAALHEYTDWERPVQHPISVRDETLDALADAQVVAPLIRVADLHSQTNAKSYFYVFEYQSKSSDYSQRLGCVHGEDLLYVFGVPLYFYSLPSSSGSSSSSTSSLLSSSSYAGGSGNSGGSSSSGSGGSSAGSHGIGGGSSSSLMGSSAGEVMDASPGLRADEDGMQKLGFFSGNFTRNEVQLSQTVILLWSNFIRTGNPNEGHSDGESGGGGSSSGQSGGRLATDKSKSAKVVDWPPYDPLYKKYLTIDMKPRVRTHYRAHKLSFWLHLVPDLMKNGYGAGGSHHVLNAVPGYGGAGGQTILSTMDGTGPNVSTPSPPTNSFVGPPLWEHKPNYHGNLTPGEGEVVAGPATHGPGSDADGFQLYSTALSVTIAIGCSLLILNILIFAAFYYQRDKRRNSNEGSVDHMDRMSMGGGGGGGGPGGHHHVRRKENGQVIQHTGSQSQQHHMPNICGELPAVHPSSASSDCGDVYGGSLHQHRVSTLKRSEMKQGQMMMGGQSRTGSSSNLKNSYEMTMPDAILAAAMMNINYDGSPDYTRMASINRNCPRRSSLTLKEQQLAGGGGGGSIAGISVATEAQKYESGSQTCPRPPKRTTPTVKFSPETNLGTSPGESSGVGASSTSYSNFSSQTLKPSLKKNYSTYSPNLDDLKV